MRSFVRAAVAVGVVVLEGLVVTLLAARHGPPPAWLPVGLAVQWGLLVAALYDLLGRKATRVLRRWGWGGVIVLVNTFGPLAYFVCQRE